ncbi:MAG: tryptophan--tRNA ligase [Chloroflexi bacterium]|nr:MAG: tryptophan--tRNA ligase [Chloroflexota bacterium]
MFEEKTVLTGIKPTGTPHLGNLVGAIKPVIEMSNQAEKSYIFIADLHALNAVRDSKLIEKWSYEVAATFLALGLDTEKAVFFRQSDVPEIYKLTVFLLNVTSKGLMNRSHAYKAISAENEANDKSPDFGINMGLYTYPILMAADILLYNTDLVPVGQDQKQHVEMARDIAGSLNNIYGDEILVVPEPVIQKVASAIPGLDGRKMSKSYGNYVPIFAEQKKLKKSIMKIVTDSKRPEDPKDPDESTIYQLYQHFAPKAEADVMREQFVNGGLGYGDAKKMLFEMIDSTLAKPREKYYELLANPEQIEDVLLSGAKRARIVAKETVDRVSKAMLGRVV